MVALVFFDVVSVVGVVFLGVVFVVVGVVFALNALGASFVFKY